MSGGESLFSARDVAAAKLALGTSVRAGGAVVSGPGDDRATKVPVSIVAEVIRQALSDLADMATAGYNARFPMRLGTPPEFNVAMKRLNDAYRDGGLGVDALVGRVEQLENALRAHHWNAETAKDCPDCTFALAGGAFCPEGCRVTSHVSDGMRTKLRSLPASATSVGPQTDATPNPRLPAGPNG